ncbi:exocyst complex component 3-like [Pollicipes pollicipes]|uniref:exocyst complex component 3-like n=1 Tax=Pollicipes pollicipes TaxID=41117 RepID=UPI001884C51F|nr:exocyst complex component 3-like [Pollicipes pollicipes]XP_037086880.1 exocyst complex component 3-like [Pollicipes pollicipes]
MNIQKLEMEAQHLAWQQVANMLQRPDQLEKVNQYKQRVVRKKNSVEAMLKTAMQSQLDDVKLGLNQLQAALQDIQESRHSLQEIEAALAEVPALLPQFSDLREESRLHQQYEAAVCTMDFTLMIDKFVERAQKVMQQSTLLAAHKYLIELERTRDRLLLDLLRKLGGHSSEVERLKAHFKEVEALSDRLGKQLWLKLSRTLATVRREPQEIVTALRIIEREEQADAELLSGGHHTDYVPPGRPKRWRQRALQVLEDAVNTRVEANAFESRVDNKMWLVRHLEVCRQLVLEDLQVVVKLCVVCFPPEYDILNTYVKMYHTALSKHLMDTIASGLEGNEYFTLLSWSQRTYPGPELLGHPSLGINVHALPPLLDADTRDKLVKDYVEKIEANYQSWLTKTIEQEAADWRRDEPPDVDGDRFLTAAPLIVFQMIDQNLQVAKSVSDDFAMQVLSVSLAQVTNFGDQYRQVIVAYKVQHFVDRSQIRYFTHYVIAIVNNCSSIMELAKQTKDRYWKPAANDHGGTKALEGLLLAYRKLRDDTIGFLLEEMSLDLEPHFRDLLTRKWMTSPEAVNTICATVEDYCHDYVHLNGDSFDTIVLDALAMIYQKYLTALLQKRMTFKSLEERQQGADKIVSDTTQLTETFERISAASRPGEDTSADTILRAMAEVLRVEDADLLTLELHGLLRHCPDATADHLTALLLLRGDLGRLEVRQRVQQLLEAAPAPGAATVLSRVQVPNGLFNLT